MTPEQHLVKILQASLEGKIIERYWNTSGWAEVCPFSEMNRIRISHSEYRIKPEPKTRPWSKPEDVPMNCWLKWDGNKTANWFITCVTDTGIGFFDSSYTAEWAKLQEENAHYSTDRKTWHKCEVVEEV